MIPALASLRAGWNRFWFTPTSTAPVELFRIGFGILATLWFLSMAPVMNPFLGTGGAVPAASIPTGAWTLFALTGGSPWIWILWLLGLVAGLGLTVGYRTRVAAVIVFVITASITRSIPTVFNAGDGLVRILAFYMMLMPAGSAVSVDRWLHDRAGMWSFPRRAPWALRLVQVQVSVVYLGTVWEKTGGVLWRNGTAVSYSLRVEDITRLPVPHAIADSAVLSELMSYGTLAIEIALGVLVWNKAARPWVLWLGVLLHLSIELTLDVGFFGLAILSGYLAFVSPDAATRTMEWVRDRLMAALSRSRDPRAAASTTAASTTAARAVPAARRAPDAGRGRVPAKNRPAGVSGRASVTPSQPSSVTGTTVGATPRPSSSE